MCMIECIFMEDYSPIGTLLNIKYTILKGNSSRDEEIQKITKEILNIIPSKRSFNIKNNIAVSTKNYENANSINDYYIDNNLPISALL